MRNKRHLLMLPNQTCQIITFLIGIIFLLKFIICACYFPEIHIFVQSFVKHQTSLFPGSHFLRVWSDPPIVPRLRIHVFNVTNAEEFLMGREGIRVEEIGPFTYEARPTKLLLNWNRPSERLTFRSKTIYRFLPHESILSDDQIVTAPNVLLLSGMLKSEVKSQPDFVKQNVVWPILTSTGHKSAFVQRSVSELVWGLEDELACLDTDKEDDSGDEWFEEEVVKKKKRNFRRQDGKCVFGVIAELNNTWSKAVEIQTGESSLYDKGKILSIDNATSFNIWNPKNSTCDVFRGDQEPTALSPTKQNQTSFQMFMGVMCRSIKMRENGVRNVLDGIETVRFVAAEETFDFRDGEGCFGGSQLPFGAMGAQKCSEGAPMAASFPRFLHGSPWYHETVSGLLPASSSSHQMYVDLEPNLGIPVGMRISFQVNIILQRDSNFPPLAHLAPGLTVLPIFWAQEGFDSLGTANANVLKLALMAPDIVAYGLVSMSLAVSVLCLTVSCVSGLRTLRTRKRCLRELKPGGIYLMVPLKEEVLCITA